MLNCSSIDYQPSQIFHESKDHHPAYLNFQYSKCLCLASRKWQKTKSKKQRSLRTAIETI